MKFVQSQMALLHSHKISDFSGKPVIITVGMFDGLHRGHQHFLKAFLKLSNDLNLEPVLIGMYPHPRKFLYDLDFQCLTSVDEKTKRLEALGVPNYLLLNTNRELLSNTAVEFVNMLKDQGVDVRAVAMGFNNRFGRPVKDEAPLENQMQSIGVGFYRISPYGDKVSSTLIREALSQGRLDYANQMLGYNYTLVGKVVPGNQIGRKIGFPTANIRVNAVEKIIPAVGVYAVLLRYHGVDYQAMMNVGYRPTIKEKVKSLFLEVHIPNHDLELYDAEVELKFLKRIRDEKQFDSLDDLTKQLNVDKDFIIQYFNTNFVDSKN